MLNSPLLFMKLDECWQGSMGRSREQSISEHKADIKHKQTIIALSQHTMTISEYWTVVSATEIRRPIPYNKNSQGLYEYYRRHR